MICFNDFYKNKKVFITGHTGFKGSWLSLWLNMLGAEVAGFSNCIPTEPSNYLVSGVDKIVKNYTGDIRNYSELSKAINDFNPDIVFHLAAQPLVRKSYLNPVETFETNINGTLNLLEAVRNNGKVKSLVVITSDKCYRNVEWKWGYRENDELGGDDPYSASKGAAEIVYRSYFHSYLKYSITKSATARAGNVIGGGDWALDRIIPDAVRAWSNNKPVIIRYPEATRPWQLVLEPLSGYLTLGWQLSINESCNGESYNFGPDAKINKTVREVLDEMSKYWDTPGWIYEKPETEKKEAGLLKLCCDKALFDLKWHAVLSFEETIKFTTEWYKEYYTNFNKKSMNEYSKNYIINYINIANKNNLFWSSKK